MTREVLLMVAPNGARLGKEEVPSLPLTPAELAAEAKACREAGAAALHLHVRDEAGAHSLDPDHYRAAIAAIREAIGDDMLVQVTTEAAGRFAAEEQMRCVRALVPPAVSLALRELLPVDADEDRRRRVIGFFRWLHIMNLAPQLICYDPAEVERVIALRREDVIPWPRPFLLFVLGSYRGREASPNMLDDFLAAFAPLRDEGAWMACAFGPRQIEVLTEAARRGGHVRVGFENGRWLAGGGEAETNAELVAALARRLRGEGLALMSPSAARALMRRITAN